MHPEPAPPSLPYPHARNDCTACREHDADVELLAPDAGPHTPGKQPVELCQRCLGPHLAWRAIQHSGPGLDQPVTILLRPAAGRRST
jgi:hypothetical protein